MYKLHQILIHTTSECNFQCKHCYAGEFIQKLSGEEINRILHDAHGMGASLCHLSGGEFFTRTDFEEIINTASELFPFVEVTSNGSLLTPEICKILKNKISKLVISLEGANAELNDYIRGEGNFLKALFSIKLAKSAGINVGVNFTITHKNVGYIKEMIDFSEKMNIGFVNFRRFIPIGNGKINQDLKLNSAEYLKLNLAIAKARKTNKTIAMAGDPTRILLDADFCQKATFAGCMAGVAILAINPNGDVTPCGYLNVPVGNIRKSPLSEIWDQSVLLNKLRDRNNLENKCGKCVYKMKCGGCRATSFAETGNIFGNDDLCWIKEQK